MFREYTLTRLPTTGTIVERAYAKVNLLLQVGPRRPDGYHEIATLLQHVALHDRVTITWSGVRQGTHGPVPQIEVTSDDGNLPSGEENLAVRAFRLLEPTLGRLGIGEGIVRIHIQKRIPVAAGLGGGSANAAAVLRGMNHCFQLGLTIKELAELGAQIGSDVPACVYGGTIFCQGRGEKVTSVESETVWWVLASAGGALRAGEVYSALDERFGAGFQEGELQGSMDVTYPGLKEALLTGKPERLAPYVVNDLERPVGLLEPRTVDLVSRMKTMGVNAALVSGSGPTVAGLVPDAVSAKTVAQRLRPTVPWVWWGPSVDPGQMMQCGA